MFSSPTHGIESVLDVDAIGCLGCDVDSAAYPACRASTQLTSSYSWGKRRAWSFANQGTGLMPTMCCQAQSCKTTSEITVQLSSAALVHEPTNMETT